MTFLDYIAAHDARSTLMERMMRTVSVDQKLKTIADHANVAARAADRCRSCGKQETCAQWLEVTALAPAPPEYCRNADLIARLQRSPSP